MNTQSGLFPKESGVQLPRFQTKSGERMIDSDRIVFLSAQGTYTLFHLEDGEQVVTSHSIGTYAPLLESRGFMRLHKSYLLNLAYLNQCRVDRYLLMTLPSGHTLEIARRKRSVLRKMIKRSAMHNIFQRS